jgi:asparagine synthase (glutamine-hydrolysing)
MCGIAGIFDRDGGNDASAVSRMLDVQAHRGPDGCGTWADPGIVLGHRRLAFLDLSHEGAQPMSFGEDRWVITYNGEIYDYVETRATLERLGHSFRSTSDTEVLLAAYAEWGTDCLHRLNGMFAFAIWDRRERTLFVGRDRLGVKPLVYTWDGKRFGFASEAKALHAAGLAPGGMNPDAVYEYLARGYTSAGRSFHADVHVLEPGHAMLVTQDKPLRTWQWWNPERGEDAAFGSASDWAERIGELLDDAVRIRLRADVPVGAHLSGGLDSSAIAAAAARHHAGNDPLQTFTGAFVDDAASDERTWSRSVAAHTGAQLHEVEIGVDQLAENFARILWHMDEPIAGPGVFPQMMVSDLVARTGVKAVLGGQGGDELFGGYLRHRALHYKLRAGGNAGTAGRIGGALELARLARGEWRRVRRTSTRATDADLAPAFLDQVDASVRDGVRLSALSHASARELMWHDLRAYLPALLHVEDRTSMAASIESRTPLLDYRLVEMALRIPEELLFAHGDPKPLLRRAVRDWLPADVTNRRDKKGFPTPLQYWRERPALRDMVIELTSQSRASAGAWSVPAQASGGAVFSDAYLADVNGFQASELWTVLTINGWLSTLADGAFAHPRQAAPILEISAA